MNGPMHEHRWVFPGPWRRASLVLLRKAWQILRGETSGGTWNKGIDPWISLIPVSFLRISANLWWRGPWDAVMPHWRREDKLRFLRNLTNGNPVKSLLFPTTLVHLNWKFLTKHLNFYHSQFYCGAPRLNFSHFKGVLGIEDIVVLAACDAIAETKLWAFCHHSLTVDHPYQDLSLVLSVHSEFSQQVFSVSPLNLSFQLVPVHSSAGQKACTVQMLHQCRPSDIR